VGRTFSFLHSHGLGVLIVGDNVPDILQRLCHLKVEEATYVRLAFSTFGRFVKAQAIESTLRSKLEELDSTNKQMVTDRRKTEIESYKYEIQLASALQERDRQMEEFHRQIEETHSALKERDRQIEEVHRVNEILMRSLSMRLTRPFRALKNLVRRLR
jgi:predicted RNase H-like nuclease (RuvC/YqgF family)